MFRKTSPQQSLLENQFLLPPEKRARLERSWARGFRERVLPVIDEELYRGCFDAGNGRPNKSIQLLVALDIIKAMFDWTDAEVIDALEFNLQIQYAVGVEARTAHVCQKTLHNHRVRTLQENRAQELFAQITRELAEIDGISVSRQRLDSTHVVSNIAVLTRLGLFVETITAFLKEVRRRLPARLEALDAQYSKRYLEREGYFSDAKRGQARRRLRAVASDLYWLIKAFEDVPDVQALDSYATLVRLFEEQCELVDGDDGEVPVAAPSPEPLEDMGSDDEDMEEGGLVDVADDEGPITPPDGEEASGEEEGPAGERVRLLEGKEISPASLQSPHDPDATYGHKGKGYEAQVSETCGEDNPYQLITAMAVNGANESDQRATVPVVDQLAERDLAPDELIADTGYGSGENIVACAERGVELVAPVQDPNAKRGPDRLSQPVERDVLLADQGGRDGDGHDQGGEDAPTDEEPLALTDFDFDELYREVLACPGGRAPVEWKTDRAGKTVWSYFAAEGCAVCPLADRCPTRRRKDGTRRLRHRRSKVATSARQGVQQTAAFKERYKIRSGIEATNAELKGRHGAGRLRVRGQDRVERELLMQGLAVNVKRASWHHVSQHHVSQHRETACACDIVTAATGAGSAPAEPRAVEVARPLHDASPALSLLTPPTTPEPERGAPIRLGEAMMSVLERQLHKLTNLFGGASAAAPA